MKQICLGLLVWLAAGCATTTGREAGSVVKSAAVSSDLDQALAVFLTATVTKAQESENPWVNIGLTGLGTMLLTALGLNYRRRLVNTPPPNPPA